MKSSRRQYPQTSLVGGLATALPATVPAVAGQPPAPKKENPRYEALDEILKKPVLKRELFSTPGIVETLELLRYKDSFLCRVRSRDGAKAFRQPIAE